MKFHFGLKELCLIAFLSVSCQIIGQRTGNIVEYFGKEKVNEINEGKLIHVFKEGLVVSQQSIGLNSSTFPVDPVFNRFLMNPEYTPKNNAVFDINALGNEMKWQSITVDETNSFSSRNLRSGYVYLTYKSNSEKIVLFEASGHSLALINGLPHEGDHYDFGWNLIPVKLKKGTNVFVLKVGRFPRIRARLISPQQPIMFTTRDVTVPDLLIEEDKDFVGAIRVVNTSSNWVKGYSIVSEHSGIRKTTKIPAISPMSVRKVPFNIAPTSDSKGDKISVKLSLQNKRNQEIANNELSLNIKSNTKHHKRTFISDIDGSTQYFSVAPSLNQDSNSQAMFLSVHGASVEATNQARAYKQKDWGNLIAPTNRRPFGFAWEDWGRLDALEVLNEAKNIYKPDLSKIYLTGHSMGGHGTWYLGATYPDYFAAIAPCAGYPDLLEYRNSFMRRRATFTPEQLKSFGITPKMLERMSTVPVPTMVDKVIERAGTPSRTLKLIRNYLQQGVYVLHGEKDNVVPTFLAQDMRERLGEFHPDFTYYEYPDGTHWYGDHSVDWKPIFDFFKQRSIKKSTDVKKMEFYTGSPGVSAKSHFITIHQQQEPFKVSSFKFSKENGVKLELDNVALVEVDLSQIDDEIKSIEINKTKVEVNSQDKLFFEQQNDNWVLTTAPSLNEKGPHRNGGFKDAFRNNLVLVYASKGSKEVNNWYYNRARFDAETFWYRANGNVEVVKDVDFNPNKYSNRNVIIYGNKDNNAAWGKLLNNSPVQVKNNSVDIAGKIVEGDQWGMYFIVPRSDSDNASVGVVTATGTRGMKAAYANHYLVNGTTFPDVLLFDDSVLTTGSSGVKCAGFFGNNWSVETGDFEWK